jgi:putative transposase
MVFSWWIKIPDKFIDIKLDVFVIMPNHIHGIIFINNNSVQDDPRVSPKREEGNHMGLPLHNETKLPEIIRWFKTMTTNEYIRNVKQNDWHPFDKKLWQRNYYEHIIRSEKSLEAIRKYIIENPLKWEVDEENPVNNK